MNFDEDLSPMSPGNENTLLMLKRARKQVEADAQLLANRIALLKQEEMRSWKKIQETKHKAQEIFSLKKQNEDRLQEKQIKTLKTQGTLKDVQSSLTEMRKQREREKKEMMEAIQYYKQQEALRIKEESQKNDQRKREFKEKVVGINQHKSQKVKEQESLTILKRKEAQMNKLVQNRLEYERRMAEEEMAKRQKEAEVLRMEKLEMDLIKKLHHTQNVQKSAYQELEDVLSQSPTDYMKKHNQTDAFKTQPGGQTPSRNSEFSRHERFSLNRQSSSRRKEDTQEQQQNDLTEEKV